MADDGSPVDGSRSAGNSAMLETAFLYGGSAMWLEQMQAAYAKNPASVPESWRAFFAELNDDSADAAKNADGASWKRGDWPRPVSDEQVAAFDGNWALVEPKLEKKLKSAKPAASAEEIAQNVKDSIDQQEKHFKRQGHRNGQQNGRGQDADGWMGGFQVPVEHERHNPERRDRANHHGDEPHGKSQPDRAAGAIDAEPCEPGGEQGDDAKCSCDVLEG